MTCWKSIKMLALLEESLAMQVTSPSKAKQCCRGLEGESRKDSGGSDTDKRCRHRFIRQSNQSSG